MTGEVRIGPVDGEATTTLSKAASVMWEADWSCVPTPEVEDMIRAMLDLPARRSVEFTFPLSRRKLGRFIHAMWGAPPAARPRKLRPRHNWRQSKR